MGELRGEESIWPESDGLLRMILQDEANVAISAKEGVRSVR